MYVHSKKNKQTKKKHLKAILNAFWTIFESWNLAVDWEVPSMHLSSLSLKKKNLFSERKLHFTHQLPGYTPDLPADLICSQSTPLKNLCALMSSGPFAPILCSGSQQNLQQGQNQTQQLGTLVLCWMSIQSSQLCGRRVHQQALKKQFYSKKTV